MIRVLRGLWRGAGMKPILGLIGIIVLQAVAIWAITGQRTRLQRWQDDVAQATRDAADHPKLATSAVPQQIRNLGTAITKTRSAMWQAKAEATAAKLAADTANEARRKDADYALSPELERGLRHADAYARAQPVTGRMQCVARTGEVDRGDDRRGDLPGTADPTSVADGPGAEPALVFVPRSAIDTCTTLKVRLDNAHDWAVGRGQ
ncbi:MAG: hypothetical protein NTX28_10130 [Novosphingobium sp.]|nr:hypothetical protein [Novosphingobium sp.]